MAQYLNKLSGARVKAVLPRLGIFRSRILDRNGNIIGSFARGRIYDLNSTVWGSVCAPSDKGMRSSGASYCGRVTDRYGMTVGEIDAELNIMSSQGRYLGTVKHEGIMSAFIPVALTAVLAVCTGVVVGFLL